MSRFERLCWLWAVENEYLRGCIGHAVRFEEVISDYEYFRQEILDPLCLDIPEETWRKAVRLPKNVTKQYGIPHWTTWKDSETQAFLRICGREMRANGYKID
jgi:hypothetical protein